MDKFEIIQQLMKELQESMEPGEADFDERLGRRKPDVEIVKMSADKLPLEKGEEMLGEDLDDDMEMGEDPRHASMVLDKGSEDDELLRRLQKMRG